TDIARVDLRGDAVIAAAFGNDANRLVTAIAAIPDGWRGRDAGPESLALFERIELQFYSVFFFQAEDGIRVFHVTGVQTCALPISGRGGAWPPSGGRYGQKNAPDEPGQTSQGGKTSMAGRGGLQPPPRRGRRNVFTVSAAAGGCRVPRIGGALVRMNGTGAARGVSRDPACKTKGGANAPILGRPEREVQAKALVLHRVTE